MNEAHIFMPLVVIGQVFSIHIGIINSAFSGSKERSIVKCHIEHFNKAAFRANVIRVINFFAGHVQNHNSEPAREISIFILEHYIVDGLFSQDVLVFDIGDVHNSTIGMYQIHVGVFVSHQNHIQFFVVTDPDDFHIAKTFYFINTGYRIVNRIVGKHAVRCGCKNHITRNGHSDNLVIGEVCTPFANADVLTLKGINK